jgi:amino acid adenylation domain-containing protein
MHHPEWLYQSDRTGRHGKRVPLSQLFQYGATEFGAREAIADGEASYTFEQLERGAQRVASVLQEAGVRHGDKVAVLTSKRACIPLFAASIWKLGAVYVPIDSQNPPARTEKLLQQLQPAAVLGNSADLEKIAHPSVRLSFSSLLDLAADPSASAWSNYPEVKEDEPAYIIFTSGSTGTPKGVMISHGSLLDYFYNHNQVLRFTSESRVLSFAPFHFDVSIEDTILPLSLGAFVYQYRGMTISALVRRVLTRYKITHIIAVSTVLTVITSDSNPLTSQVLPDLKMIMTGAEVCDPKIINTWKRNFPDGRVINAYGPTEATIVCLTHTIEKPDDQRTRSYPIGRPLDGVLMKIIGEQKEITQAGEEGELWIGGSQVMIGYLGDAEATARAVQVRDGVRYYRTGDVCRLDENGNVEFVGRQDDEVKLAGRRINLREVSQPALAYGTRAFAGVLSKNGSRQLGLVVISDDGATVLDSVKEHLREQLPEYMRPHVLAYAEQPVLSSTGKTNESHLLTLLNSAWQHQSADQYVFGADGNFTPRRA